MAHQLIPHAVAHVDFAVPSTGTRTATLIRATGTWTGWTVDGASYTASTSAELVVTVAATALGGRWRLIDPAGLERIVGRVVRARPGSTSDDVTIDVSTGDVVVEVEVVGSGVQLDDLADVATSGDYADLTNRTHAAAHAAAGSDPLTLTQAQVTGLVSDLAVKVPGTRTVNGHALTADVTLDHDDVGADGAGTAAARTLVGLLSARPSAAALADGVRYLATDDSGGTVWVVSSGAWVQAAPPVSGPSRVLAIAEPSSAPTQVIGAINTDYRITSMTVDFTMPAQRVRIDTSELWIFQLLVNTSAQMSLWYSVDAWATKVCLAGVQPPSTPGTSPFWFHRFGPQSVFIPSSVAAGSAVSAALFVATSSGTPTLTVGVSTASDRGATRKPFLSAVAL